MVNDVYEIPADLVLDLILDRDESKTPKPVDLNSRFIPRSRGIWNLSGFTVLLLD